MNGNMLRGDENHRDVLVTIDSNGDLELSTLDTSEDRDFLDDYIYLSPFQVKELMQFLNK